MFLSHLIVGGLITPNLIKINAKLYYGSYSYENGFKERYTGVNDIEKRQILPWQQKSTFIIKFLSPFISVFP